MAGRKYTASDYACMLEWYLSDYALVRTEALTGGGMCLRMAERPMELPVGAVEGLVWAEGRMNIFFETAVKEDAAETQAVLEALNRINSRPGVTFFLKKDMWGMKLCAREELYMDHLTQAAAKRTVKRIMTAVLDVRCGLDELARALNEYFGAEALAAAEDVRKAEMEEWTSGAVFKEQNAEVDAPSDEEILWDDDEELPF